MEEIKQQATRKLQQIMEKRNEREYEWVKHTLTIIATVFGLIIALKDGSSKTQLEQVIFIVTIISTALCILCGLIFLYADTDTRHSLAVQYAEHIFHPLYNGESFPEEVVPKKIFSILRVCFFVFLILSILSLSLYAIFQDSILQ